MSYKHLLSPHGRTIEIAQWVVETKSPLLDTDEYRNNRTIREWIEGSKEVVAEYYENKLPGSCSQ